MKQLQWKTMTLIGIGIGLVLLIAANAHLVYVAFSSAPDCVPHAKESDDMGPYRAARSAC
ncbi:hypothetical protein [Govanella unica]|uniref:Uncharacterized protein n=1 Tax=Govanella unica TaxID=2975056 RepID=A0A9X3TZ97_9PROT|nr:hypothetical protein [Govania unica]MDA5194457.1 hypothetical protein [Govania unica]